MHLPEAKPNQTYVTVHAIDAGSLTLPEDRFVSPGSSARRTVPSLSFLVTHPRNHASNSKPLHILFDLGMRVSAENYTPEQRGHLESRKPVTLGPGVLKTLLSQNIGSEEVEVVILSHVHWDHTGDPQHFPTSRFFVGPGSLEVLKNGLPGKGSHQNFDPKIIPPERTSELPKTSGAEDSGEWKPLGDFVAIDFLKDGSIYVLDAPGHLPGHLNLLCRTSESSWVCLCGDSYHDVRLRTGEKQVATWKVVDKHGAYQEYCIHLDKPTAERHVAKLERLSEIQGIELIAAHDINWLDANRHRLYPNRL